jgi:hypothetical protein
MLLTAGIRLPVSFHNSTVLKLMRTTFSAIKKNYRSSGIGQGRLPLKLARQEMICPLSISGALPRLFWVSGYTKPNTWSLTTASTMGR